MKSETAENEIHLQCGVHTLGTEKTLKSDLIFNRVHVFKL